MPVVWIEPADLAPFAEITQAKAEAMIADALAMARLAAPCIDDEDFAHPEAALAVIRGAILRWHEAGSGVRTQVSDTVGPFSYSESFLQPQRRALFWPSEIDQLKKLCADSSAGKAWSYDTAGGCLANHADVCSLVFGANFCSCGAWLAGKPLWENKGDDDCGCD
jgi:hypothetical protein